jgi:pseudoazurin
MRVGLAAIAALAFGLLGGSAAAAEFEVQMLNARNDQRMQFDPPLIRIAPGDTVHFRAVDKGHNVESIPGMLPNGAERFVSKVGEDLSIKLTAQGVYGYRCTPHGSLGMVGLIIVGEPVNEEAAKSASVPGPARQAFVKLFQRLDGQLSAK